MSLNWSVEDCLDYPSLMAGREYTITEALALSTMVIGMGQITSANAKEFYTRIKILEGAMGSIAYWKADETTPKENILITPEDIFARIGLFTNVSDMTKSKFLNHIYNNVAGRGYDYMMERKRREAGDTFADRLDKHLAKAK
jgi:hypothetical protein